MDENGEKYESILINLKYDLKQNIICGAFPSLQYISLNNLAIALWQDTLGQGDFTLFNNTNISEKLNDFAIKIIDMVSDSNSIPVHFKPQLREMVYIIKKEIKIFFKCDARKFCLKFLDMYKIYWDNICWTDQSTINKVKTVEQIIDNASVSTLRKYILACNYCLEEKIENLLKLLPKNFIDFFEENKYPFKLVIFWTYYKRGEIEKFSEFTCGMETFAYLLTWAISMNMEASVQYIWENFADQTAKLEVMTKVLYLEEISPNIAFYILQNWNKNFKEKVDEEFFCSGLSKLHSISRWCNIVPLAKYLSELNSEIFNVTDAFQVASFCWHEKFFDVEQFSTLWDEICTKFEFTLKEKFIDICEEIFGRYKYDDSKKDTHIEKLLLGLCTSENKEKFINNWIISDYVVLLIIDNGTHSFDILFKEFFESEEETEFFKRIIFTKHSRLICHKLIEVENYERLNEYLINFCPEEEISKFKNEYYLYDDSVIESIISLAYYCREEDSLTYLNMFLNWSFEENDEKINQVKAKVYDLESSEYYKIHLYFFKEFKQFINKNEWELVEKYWNWIFFATEKKIVTVEENFARIKKIFSVLFQSTRFYLGTIKYCTLFKMIISLCFKKYKFEEIVEVVNRENDVAALVEEYLEFDNHLELNELLGGSFYLKENINKYTSRFMLSHSCLLMFEMNKGDSTIYKVKFFCKCFNPSVESAKLFKKSFLNFVTRKENNGCKLLKKSEKIKLIMEVGQYLIKMLKNVLNHRNIFYKEINKDISENNEHKENDKRKREDEPFNCSKMIKLSDC